MMKSEIPNRRLAILRALLCISFGFITGCDPSAEVPTPGDAPRQSSPESPAGEEQPETEALTDDPTEGEGGSYLD
jgi:hypothetical protein